MNTTNDSGVTHFQRLDPNQIDVVLGSARSQRPQAPSGQSRKGLWWLALSGIAVAGWWLGVSQSPVTVAANQPQSVASAPEAQTVTVVNQATDTRVINQVVIFNPTVQTAPKRTAPMPEATPAPPQPAQGMVSAQYLAQFKAGAGHSPEATQRPYQIATVNIREWDGPNRYVAKWRVQDSEIDQGSVCFNFMADSIGYRECRRAAQQYFKEQCKDWTRRTEKSRDKETREARAQYCTVAGAFVP